MTALKVIVIILILLWDLDTMTTDMKECENGVDKIINLIKIVVGVLLPFVIMKL